MSQETQVGDFSLDTALHVRLGQRLSVDDLQCHLLASGQMLGQLDLSERSFAQCFYDLILANAIRWRCSSVLVLLIAVVVMVVVMMVMVVLRVLRILLRHGVVCIVVGRIQGFLVVMSTIF